MAVTISTYADEFQDGATHSWYVANETQQEKDRESLVNDSNSAAQIRTNKIQSF